MGLMGEIEGMFAFVDLSFTKSRVDFCYKSKNGCLEKRKGLEVQAYLGLEISPLKLEPCAMTGCLLTCSLNVLLWKEKSD